MTADGSADHALGVSAASARQGLRRALSGEGSHVDVGGAFLGLDWRLAGRRPAGAPHSVFRLLGHMIYWQDVYLERLAGASVPSPEHDAIGWPGAEEPSSEDEWKDAVARFSAGLARAMRAAESNSLDLALPNFGGRTRHETLHLIASHNSYHVGQVALLRRMLETWPPPGGGDSW